MLSLPRPRKPYPAKSRIISKRRSKSKKAKENETHADGRSVLAFAFVFAPGF